MQLKATRHEFDNPVDWSRFRHNYIGGSDAWKIAQGRWIEVWADKTWRIPSSNPSPPMRAGHALENLISDLYREETEREIIDPGDFTVFTHPLYPWIGCTIDRFQNDPNFGLGVLELKAPTFAKDPLCDEYWTQGEHQTLTTELPWGSVAAFPAHRQLEWEGFHADLDYQERLVEVYARFWHYVVTDTQPPADEGEAACQILKRSYCANDGTTVTLPDSLIPLDEEYAEIERQLKICSSLVRPLEKRRKELQAKLYDYIRTASSGVFQDRAVYTKTIVNRKAIPVTTYPQLKRKEISNDQH